MTSRKFHQLPVEGEATLTIWFLLPILKSSSNIIQTLQKDGSEVCIRFREHLVLPGDKTGES